MKSSNDYIDGSAYGQAPFGPAPGGQSPGAVWPGNSSINKSTANANPSDHAMRVDALYATIERNDLKSEAGERMMHQLTSNGQRVTNISPNVRRAIGPQDNFGPKG